MNCLVCNVRTLFFALATALASCASQAGIYKWVDAKGQVHYSERKSDANGAKTSEVNVLPAPPASPITPPASTEYAGTPSKFVPPPPAPQPKLEANAPSGKPPVSLSGGREHGTNTSRCALAKDVLSGAVVHGNGKPTDKYDREVAQNDVKAFCNNR